MGWRFERGSMQLTAGMEDVEEEYARALVALSGLISSHRRADGKFWDHAFEGMKVYLEVCPHPSHTPRALHSAL